MSLALLLIIGVTLGARAGSFSTDASRFQHADFSQARPSFQQPQFSPFSAHQPNAVSHTTETFDPKRNAEFSPRNVATVDTPSLDTLNTYNGELSDEQSRFQNMRMEFSNPDLQHLNFNTR